MNNSLTFFSEQAMSKEASVKRQRIEQNRKLKESIASLPTFSDNDDNVDVSQVLDEKEGEDGEYLPEQIDGMKINTIHNNCLLNIH